MVTSDAFDESKPSFQVAARRRWLRRAGAAAIATAVIGIGGTGLSVAVLSAKQPDSTGSTVSSTSSDDSGSSSSSSDDSSGSSGNSSSSGSGLGSTSSNSTSQGGSNGS